MVGLSGALCSSCGVSACSPLWLGCRVLCSSCGVSACSPLWLGCRVLSVHRVESVLVLR
ncbi:hypothetical protein CAPTEDRAFT_124705 [Capitella teleta]|uniref:Secreted protein n=1 Tax=Capitella teleta TaxID=283909 RepID=R7UPQ1_CAPTE|nr:hypothetical protein CAPTEDRAFT_124705 [Capitella teleta]|eukprot:ELU05411.1 hypothetical protein CAPTEDRAFT_124705 [Capitella teleta]